MKTYSELITIPDFLGRYNYLKLSGQVGVSTFGYDRYLNQIFYKSDEWLSFRNGIIIRDLGCDLGLEGYDIFDMIIIHHLNPITKEDLLTRSDRLLDPENVIVTSSRTHNAIHYGDETLLPTINHRSPNDTIPWR